MAGRVEDVPNVAPLKKQPPYAATFRAEWLRTQQQPFNEPNGILHSILEPGFAIPDDDTAAFEETVSANAAVIPKSDKLYKLCEEATQRSGVLQGRLYHHQRWAYSQVYPGTERTFSVYIPAVAAADGPPTELGLLVILDGSVWHSALKVQTVLDNLIHDGRIQPVLGVFTTPGYCPADGSEPMKEKQLFPGDYAGWLQRFHEFDMVNEKYARHVLEEVLPFVEREYSIRISQNPQRRCIAGQSSAGLCSLITAWQRPESFGRVLAVSPSFAHSTTGLLMPAVVARTTPAKPLRMFLTAGELDIVLASGATKDYTELMASSLQRKGYEHQLRIGPGAGHTLRFVGSMLGEALTWLFNTSSVQSRL